MEPVSLRRRSGRRPSRPWPPPYPPEELRIFVGRTDDEAYDNPTGSLVFDDIPAQHYDSVFDWGCGCGRIARQLMLQEPQPQRYVGIDLHRGMVEWCAANLTPSAPHFEFHHHDVHNPGLNPSGSHDRVPFPAPDASVGLFVAWSVFTHVTERAASYYLGELARVLRPGGIAKTTWFLFDKIDFPMMQDFQNALYINDVDPTNAVIFDRQWLRDELSANGLVIAAARAPGMRGFQQQLNIALADDGAEHADIPDDTAPRGHKPPPLPAD